VTPAEVVARAATASLESSSVRKLAGLLLCVAAAAGCASSQTYGARPALDALALPLARALVASNVGKTIALEGKVADVCQMKGCWMVLTDGTLAVRTTFKNYGFFVPKDLAGRAVVAEGVLTRETVDEATRRHYAEDAGQSPEQIAAIRGPIDDYTFIASSVTVRPSCLLTIQSVR
jgi:hypothetical protein